MPEIVPSLSGMKGVRGRSPAIGVGKKLPLTASDDVVVSSTVGRDQSRNLALIMSSLYYPVQTKDRLKIVAAREGGRVNR